MRKYIVIDVGSFKGSKSLFMSKQNPNGVVVHAFDPLYSYGFDAHIFDVIKKHNLNQYLVYNQAVSDYDGIGKFYICSLPRFSSLLPFSQNSQQQKNWPKKVCNKLKINKAEDVTVVTLKRFCEMNDIDHIDLLKIDARGEGLKVLKGLGDKISMVETGSVEVSAINRNDVLYKNQATYEQVVGFLEGNGFHIDKTKNKDARGNIVELFFSK